LKRRPRVFYGWVVLVAALTITGAGYALRNIFSVFYPVLVEEFGWERGGTALMFSIHVLVYGLTAPLAGSLVDRFDPRVTFSVGACVMGTGIALCSLATAQWQFYLLYGVVVAVGVSMTGVSPFNAILSRWFVRRRAIVFGILSLGFGMSLVAAPAVQSLISSFGWQNAFVAIGIFTVAVIVPVSVLLMCRSPNEKGLLPDGASRPPTKPEVPSAPREISGPRSEWIGTAWTLRRALKTYQFWLLFLVNFCMMGVAQHIAIAHQVYFFRDVGYEPMLAATAFSVFGISLMVGYLCGSLSDRLGRERVFIPGCLTSAAGASLLFLITDASQPWMLFLFAVLFGTGMGAAITSYFATMADLFQGRYFGSIQGSVIVGFALGGAVSPWLAGFLHDVTGSYFIAFVAIVGALLLCAGLMWFIAPGKLRPVPSRAGR